MRNLFRTAAARGRSGLNAEEIAENIGHLSLAQIHAVLADYHSNREEIDA